MSCSSTASWPCSASGAARAWSPSPGTLELDHWPEALQSLAKDGKVRSLEIARVDGDPVGEAAEVAQRLKDAGFTDGYKGLTFRA